MKDENSYAWQMAEAWDHTHGAMPPVPTPDGYKSTYEYKTAAACIKPVPAIYMLTAEPGEDWGIVSMLSERLLDGLELKGMMLELREKGIRCPGEMRLVSQKFKLDI